jgi:hypothetical protein
VLIEERMGKGKKEDCFVVLLLFIFVDNKYNKTTTG